jgi:hypothetical protein
MFEFMVSENVGQNLYEFISKDNIYSNNPRAEVKKKGKVFPLHAMKAYREVEV